MVGTIDLLSPDDEALRERYNHLERLRDPSHTTALTRTQAIRSMEEVGLSMTLVDTRDIPVDFHRWVTMTGTDRQNTGPFDLPPHMYPHPELGCGCEFRFDDHRCGWPIT
jgi:hypothetical protein